MKISGCVACLILAAWATPSSAARSYDNCAGFIATLPAVISTQGTWCMNKDLATSTTSGAGITITTNNVILDCNDFKLGNLSAGPNTMTIGIHSVGRLNHTVRNCNVRGFYFGVALETTNEGIGGGHVVEDSRFEASRYVGIFVAGLGSIVRRNVVLDTGGNNPLISGGLTAGIAVANDTEVVDNRVLGVTAFQPVALQSVVGISAFETGSPIRGNVVYGLVSSEEDASLLGIWARNGTRTLIERNHLASEPSAVSIGIECDPVESALVRDNVVAGFEVAFDGCIDLGDNDYAF